LIWSEVGRLERREYYDSHCDEALLEAERCLRSAQDAIIALSEDQRSAIGSGLNLKIPDNPVEMMEMDWANWIPRILRTIAHFTETEPSRRGRRKVRRNLKLHPLIRDLWRIAQEHGGDFTAWPGGKGHAKGTMVEALRLLEPLLPGGFVPNVLSVTTLNRLRPDRNRAK